MLKLLLIALCIYGAVLVAAMLLQDRLLFPTSAVAKPGRLPPGTAQLSLDTADGNRLAGVHIPAARLTSDRLLVVAFGGNAWNAEDAANLLHHLWPDAGVVAFHYRGYAPSTGRPSASALLDDAPLILAAARRQVPQGRTIAVGLSIGSGIAAKLVGDKLVDGAILVTPFDRLQEVASGHFPWLPVRWIFRNDINSAALLQDATAPVALISAERDAVISPERTAALRPAIPNLVYDHVVPGAGHNDIYNRSDFQESMDRALDAVRLGSGSHLGR